MIVIFGTMCKMIIVCRALSYRNSISYDSHLWYMCKRCFLEVFFFSFFKNVDFRDHYQGDHCLSHSVL